MKKVELIKKDVGAARPKGILLEDALSALCERFGLDVVASELDHHGIRDFRASRFVGPGIRVEWLHARGSIPSLSVECSRAKWKVIRAFLQEKGLFRIYPPPPREEVRREVSRNFCIV